MDAKALKAALAKLPAGDIELLRLAPDRLNANVIVKGKMHVVQVTAGGDVSDITTPATGRGEPVKVNCAAPMRIARTAAKRAGRRPSSVSYLVLIHILGKDEWQLYFDDGLHFAASANGKKVRGRLSRRERGERAEADVGRAAHPLQALAALQPLGREARQQGVGAVAERRQRDEAEAEHERLRATEPAAGSMNCGRNARKNIAVFGLSASTSRPWRNSRRDEPARGRGLARRSRAAPARRARAGRPRPRA